MATYIIFIVALATLIMAAQAFTRSAEKIGIYMRLPSFVVGIFIVGIGTSLPELISAIISVKQGASEIVPGNIMGANISNMLMITGMVVLLNRRNIVLSSPYIFIDLHYLIGAFILFALMAYDGSIDWLEGLVGLAAYGFYSTYLIKSGNVDYADGRTQVNQFPLKAAILIAVAGVFIYLGAEYTVSSLTLIAESWGVPSSVIALTILSLGTTLPELAVNVSAIKQGKAEMAIGNVLGSCVFNTMIVPGTAAMIGTVDVPDNLLKLSLPVMLGVGVLFYMVTQDKRISVWEGWLFMCIYVLFLLKVIS
jgi:cation:H+ antiporter